MGRSRFAVLDRPGPAPIAHRGGAAEAPENTLSAFEHARSLGYDFLETDVHLTRDGVVVAIHDPCLDRVADRPGQLGELSWAEVSAARLADGRPVPRLDELLSSWPELRWNLDAKHDAVVGPLIETLAAAGAIERVCVSAFSDRRIDRARRLGGPLLCTGTGPAATAALRAASLLPGHRPPWAGPPGARWDPAGAVQVPLRWHGLQVLDERLVAAAHHRGLAVHVWTVDDEEEMARLLDAGVDGIMTDRPSALRRVLAGRARWSGA